MVLSCHESFWIDRAVPITPLVEDSPTCSAASPQLFWIREGGDVSLRPSSNEESNSTCSGNYSRTLPVKNSDTLASLPATTSRADCRQHLAAPRSLAVTVLSSPPMQTQPQRPPDAEKFSRSAQMVERLRRDVLYTEKRVRDRLFVALELALAESPTPLILPASPATPPTTPAAKRSATPSSFRIGKSPPAPSATPCSLREPS